MDLQKVISELVSKLTGNKDLISKFTSDPAKIIKNLLGIDLNAADLAKVVKEEGVKRGAILLQINRRGDQLFRTVSLEKK